MTIDEKTMYRWAFEDDENIAEAALATVRAIQMKNGWIRTKIFENARLYGEMNPWLRKSPRRSAPLSNSENVVKPLVDSLQAKIVKSAPIPQFLTRGGSPQQKARARTRNRFVEGQFYESDVFKVTRRVAHDACKYGTGLVFNYADYDNKKILCERMHPLEVSVDNADANNGDPCEIHRSIWVDRRELIARFPDKEKLIKDAYTPQPYYEFFTYWQDTTSDKLLVTSSWRKAYGEYNGKYVISVGEGILLESSEWEYEYLPILPMYINYPDAGFYGIGLIDELANTQRDIDFMDQSIMRAIKLMGAPHILAEKGAGVDVGKMTNEIGSIWWYKPGGQKPEVITPAPVHPDLFNFREKKIAWAHQKTGLGQLSAQGTIPKGLEGSGKAMQMLDDINTEHFRTMGLLWEELHVKIAQQQIDLGKELCKIDKNYSVRYNGKHAFEELRFVEAKFDKDDWTIRPSPVSSLSNSFFGRIAQAQSLMNSNLASPDDARRMVIDLPDMEGYLSRKDASRRLTDKMIGMMLDKGVYIEPVEEMNLEDAATQSALAALEARVDGNVPEERIELIRRFSGRCKEMLEEANAANNQTPANAPPVNPGVVPGVASVSPQGMGGAMNGTPPPPQNSPMIQ